MIWPERSGAMGSTGDGGSTAAKTRGAVGGSLGNPGFWVGAEIAAECGCLRDVGAKNGEDACLQLNSGQFRRPGILRPDALKT